MVAALLLPSGNSHLSFVPGVPQYLLPVVNTPILLRNLALCRSHGIQAIYLPVSSQEYPLFIHFLQEQLGVYLLEAGVLPSVDDQTFIVMPRELVTDCSLSVFVQKHEQQGSPVSVASENGQIFAVRSEYLPTFLQSRTHSSAHVVETFDIQIALHSADQYLLGHRLLLGREASIHKTAVIAPDAFVSYRSHIGANCYVGSGAVIGDHCCLAANCWIGADAYLHNSVCLEGVRIGVQATIENAIVAPGTVIGRTAQIYGSVVTNPISAGTSLRQSEEVELELL
jgi:UDP-3-O-[3-hydroxymyristoyl] glucosamine N-acyltransferase